VGTKSPAFVASESPRDHRTRSEDQADPLRRRRRADRRQDPSQFDIKDGTGIIWAQRAGLTVGFLSARTSAATGLRAAQLGITLVHQGVASKLESYEQIVDSLLMEDEHVAYMGDDVLDLPVLARVGLATAPADAVEDVRTRVHWVSAARGGHGAARDLVELVLRAQDRWDSLLAEYVEQPT
jgi:3-deoxy-D-manno-octulosonate 8-phosphate phosphatase (KDO 8-P phosphatase)